MNRDKVCSICGSVVYPAVVVLSGRRPTQKEREDFANRHKNIECGTWDQLVAELQRLHNLSPDLMDDALRTLLRVEDAWSSGKVVPLKQVEDAPGESLIIRP